MKILLFILVFSISCGCSTSVFLAKVSGAESLKRSDYVLKEEASTSVNRNRLWILWFPFGGGTEKRRQERCYAKFINEYKCDGIIAGKYITKKFSVPLIAICYTHFNTTLTGRPFYIKRDSIQ